MPFSIVIVYTIDVHHVRTVRSDCLEIVLAPRFIMYNGKDDIICLMALCSHAVDCSSH